MSARVFVKHDTHPTTACVYVGLLARVAWPSPAHGPAVERDALPGALTPCWKGVRVSLPLLSLSLSPSHQRRRIPLPALDAGAAAHVVCAVLVLLLRVHARGTRLFLRRSESV